MIRPPERFETDRLVLRRPSVDDAPAIFANYANDPEVTRYLTWPPHASEATTRELMPRFVEMWETHTSYPWVITVDDEAVGMLEVTPKPPRAEFGWVLSRSLWGRGIMTEAAATVTAWLLQQPDIWRVEALVDVDNPGSARVMEKLGMRREGLLARWGYHPNASDEPRDVYLYAVTR